MMGTGSCIFYKKVSLNQYPYGVNPIAIIVTIYFCCLHISVSKIQFLANAQKLYVDFSPLVVIP